MILEFTSTDLDDRPIFVKIDYSTYGNELNEIESLEAVNEEGQEIKLSQRLYNGLMEEAEKQARIDIITDRIDYCYEHFRNRKAQAGEI